VHGKPSGEPGCRLGYKPCPRACQLPRSKRIMRPEILFPVFSAVTSLPGVGPKLAQAIGKLAGPKVVDLLWHLPTGLIDRRLAPRLAEAVPGMIATVTVRVDMHRPSRVPRLPYKVSCSDDTGSLDLVFFHAHGDYLEKQLPVGEV